MGWNRTLIYSCVALLDVFDFQSPVLERKSNKQSVINRKSHYKSITLAIKINNKRIIIVIIIFIFSVSFTNKKHYYKFSFFLFKKCLHSCDIARYYIIREKREQRVVEECVVACVLFYICEQTERKPVWKEIGGRKKCKMKEDEKGGVFWSI